MTEPLTSGAVAAAKQQPLTGPPPRPPRSALTGLVRRSEGTMRRLEVTTNLQGGIVMSEMEVDLESPERHDGMRVTVFDQQRLHYDEVLPLVSGFRWIDLPDHARRADVPLPTSGIDEPGTQVRVQPYDEGKPVQGGQRLSLQITLDAPPGEHRLVRGRWSTEWPSSIWNAAVLTAAYEQVIGVYVYATDEIERLDLSWALFRIGEPDNPMVTSSDHASPWIRKWTSGGLVCLDITEQIASLDWAHLADTALELRASSPNEPDRPPRKVHMAITTA